MPDGGAGREQFALPSELPPASFVAPVDVSPPELASDDVVPDEMPLEEPPSDGPPPDDAPVAVPPAPASTPPPLSESAAGSDAHRDTKNEAACDARNGLGTVGLHGAPSVWGSSKGPLPSSAGSRGETGLCRASRAQWRQGPEPVSESRT